MKLGSDSLPRCHRDKCAGTEASPNLSPLPPSSPPAQQLSFLHSGLLNILYLHMPDCPVSLLQWLFQVRTAGLPLGGGSAAVWWPGGPTG